LNAHPSEIIVKTLQKHHTLPSNFFESPALLRLGVNSLKEASMKRKSDKIKPMFDDDMEELMM